MSKKLLDKIIIYFILFFTKFYQSVHIYFYLLSDVKSYCLLLLKSSIHRCLLQNRHVISHGALLLPGVMLTFSNYIINFNQIIGPHPFMMWSKVNVSWNLRLTSLIFIKIIRPHPFMMWSTRSMSLNRKLTSFLHHLDMILMASSRFNVGSHNLLKLQGVRFNSGGGVGVGWG